MHACWRHTFPVFLEAALQTKHLVHLRLWPLLHIVKATLRPITLHRGAEKPVEPYSEPDFAGRLAVNAYDTAGLGTAKSSWQAPLEQSGPQDDDAAWQNTRQ